MMSDNQILKIRDLLIENEVKEYFETVPVECFNGESINNTVQQISNAITDVVFSSVGLLNGYDRVTGYANIKGIVEHLVKIELMDCMIENDCVFNV